MDNTINCYSSLSFGSRYLRVKKGNTVPKTVLDAVKNNKVIDSYLKEGKPAAFFDKICDLFKRREYLEVSLDRGIYAEYDRLNFSVRKAFGKATKSGYIDVDFNEVIRHPKYESKGPRWQNKGLNLNFDIADENMVKQVNKIKSMDDIFVPKVKFAD